VKLLSSALFFQKTPISSSSTAAAARPESATKASGPVVMEAMDSRDRSASAEAYQQK